MNEMDHTIRWVAEYSPRQKAFHIEPLAEAIKNNLAVILEGRKVDYLIIACGTRHVCQLACDKLEARVRPQKGVGDDKGKDSGDGDTDS